jgi:putative chitinase
MDLTKLESYLAKNVYDELKNVCIKFNVNNKLRVCHFLSQMAHESGSFTAIRENLNYSALGLKNTFGKYFPTETLANSYARQPEKIANRVYANRMGNRDEQSGDGWKFRGRGYLQITGASNYIAFGKYIGEDLYNNPDLIATKYPLTSGAWFFEKNKLWEICEEGDTNATIMKLTRKINGGTNGFDDRVKKFNLYKRFL